MSKEKNLKGTTVLQKTILKKEKELRKLKEKLAKRQEVLRKNLGVGSITEFKTTDFNLADTETGRMQMKMYRHASAYETAIHSGFTPRIPFIYRYKP